MPKRRCHNLHILYAAPPSSASHSYLIAEENAALDDSPLPTFTTAKTNEGCVRDKSCGDIFHSHVYLKQVQPTKTSATPDQSQTSVEFYSHFTAGWRRK